MAMMWSRAFVMVIVLLAGCGVASAQEGPGAGKLEVHGFPGAGLWLQGGDNDEEVNFNNFAFGMGASWYVTPMVSVEGEESFGVGIVQDVNYHRREWDRARVPYTLAFNGNVVIFPGGSAKRVAPYVTAGAGMLRLYDRLETEVRFGLAEPESFLATNVGGGLRVFRRGDARNWGFRVDYRLLMVNSKSDAVAFFGKTKDRIGHRFSIGLLYTLKR